jgi:hypothetical protein
MSRTSIYLIQRSRPKLTSLVSSPVSYQNTTTYLVAGGGMLLVGIILVFGFEICYAIGDISTNFCLRHGMRFGKTKETATMMSLHQSSIRQSTSFAFLRAHFSYVLSDIPIHFYLHCGMRVEDQRQRVTRNPTTPQSTIFPPLQSFEHNVIVLDIPPYMSLKVRNQLISVECVDI